MKRIHKLRITAVIIAVCFAYSPVAVFSQSKPNNTTPQTPIEKIQAQMEQAKAEFQHLDSLKIEYQKALQEIDKRQTALSSSYQTLQWTLQQLNAPDTTKPETKFRKEK